MLKPLNIGLVGYGFMGRTHSNGYKRVNDFFKLDYRPVLKAVCGRSEEAAKAFAEQWGYESVETDWKALVARPDIDAIDICTPNNTHAEIALAAHRLSPDGSDRVHAARVAVARFFAENVAVESSALEACVLEGSASVHAATAALELA